MSGVSQKTREYWVAKARGWAERLSGPQDDEFNAVMDDIMLSASRAEAAEARAEQLRVGLIEFRTYFLSWREDGFMDGDVEALIKVRDALKGGEE